MSSSISVPPPLPHSVPPPVPRTIASAPARVERERGIFVGNIRGIAFYLDASWFLLLGLVIWSLASAYFPYYLPGETTLFYFGLSAISALVFYLSLLLHELGHSVVSQQCGIPVPRITLSFIGGVAEISREPDDARSELKIALGGPAVTVVLILVYYGASLAGELLQAAAVAQMFHWLAIANLFLLCFNAIPGYPLDGGRVFRALIWMKTGRLQHATYISSRVGIVFAWGLMIAGVFLLFKSPIQAFVFFLIGTFLKNAAAQGYEAAVQKETLGKTAIREVMTSEPVIVPSHLPLNLVVDDYFFTSHHSAYPVCDSDGTFLGILRLKQVTTVPKERWPYTTARDILDPGDALESAIAPDASATEVAQQMSSGGSGRLAVLENGRIIGLVTRHDIFRTVQIRSELA